MSSLLTNYYNVYDLEKEYPELFTGTKSVRGIINRHNIPENKYGYYCMKHGKYIKTEASYKKAPLYISSSFNYFFHGY